MRYQFVDCRWELGDPARGRALYLEGHIPGASFLDVDEELSDRSVPDAGRHPLPSAEAASRPLRPAPGIGPDAFVVAYGAMGGAERLWWLLRHFGHDACAVLEGGIDAWRGPLVAGDEDVEPAIFEPHERTNDTIGVDELAARLDELVVLDARPHHRYRAEPNPIDKVPGRIPGALSTPWASPLPEVPDGDVVAYCGSGVTACVTLHRLALAGRDGRLYPGSWSDWETRDLPRESG